MKRLNKEVERFGWVLIGMLLLFAGKEHVTTRVLYGRVSDEPLLQGGVVFALGLVELGLGAWVLWRQFTRR